MKNPILIAFTLICFIACNESPESTDTVATTPAIGTSPDAPVVTKDDPANAGMPDFSVAGIDDIGACKNMFGKIQAMIEPEYKERFASMISYPIAAAKDKETFLANYDKIVTDKVRQAVKNQKFENIFVNAKGCMIGDGEVWFGLNETKGIVITGINP